MKITGTYTIDAPQQLVWDALNDIDVLARVVPGCERLEQTGPDVYEGTVKVGIQSIKGTYNGKISLQEIQPPHHYKLVAAGRGSNGVIDGAGTVDLAEQDGKTLLTYGGEAAIGGTLASVGQRLIEGASRQLINQSLKALVEQIELRKNPPAAPVESAAPAPAPVTAAAASVAEPVADAVAAMGIASPEAATPAAPAFTPRAVVVPESEQLKPESVVSGMIGDFLKDRPWIGWVVAAALLGYLLGRARR